MLVNKPQQDTQNDCVERKNSASKNTEGKTPTHQRSHSQSSSCTPGYQRINSSDSNRHNSHDSTGSNDFLYLDSFKDAESSFGARLYKSEDGITNRLVVVSSKVRNVSSIRHALQPGVSLLLYNLDSFSLEDIETHISQVLNSRKLQSLAFILSCSGPSLQVLTREDMLIHRDGNVDKTLQEFFTSVASKYLQVSEPTCRIDFFSWYSLQSIDGAPQLVVELQSLTGVKVGVWRDLSGTSLDAKRSDDHTLKDSVGELYFRLERLRNWSGRHQQTLAGFEKIRTVGKGAYGAAVLYKKKDDESLVILKEINMHDLTATERQMALNEISVLAVLDHPNIISYYDSFEEDGVLMIEMEYADNGTLAQFLSKQERPLEEHAILSMFHQMVAAILYIHSHNILHRDLKTDNIFLTKEGMVKIGDFGISKMMGSANIGALTVLGTPYYISPEMCEGKQYSFKSDIWALGCILYEMACLQKTFEGSNLPAVVNKIMKGKFAPLKGSYSEEFKDLVMAMLKKNPEERPEAQSIMYTILPKLMNTDNRKSDQEDVSAGSVNKNKIRSVLYYLECSTAVLSCIHDLPPRMKIKQMAVGRDHFIVTTTERQVFTWGSGGSGQLGLGDIKDRYSPTPVESLKGKSIGMCCCGSGFSVFGSDNGLVLTCGDGSAGCLGHGDWGNAVKPKLIESLLSVDVKTIACGPRHVVIIGRNGTVMSWGDGSHGQLGLGTAESRCSPVTVQLAEPVVFNDVQCGVDGTMLISDVGGVFACGNNDNNKLGLNNRQGFLMAMKNIFTKTEVDGTKVPIPVRALARHKVLSVSMGMYHTAVIVEPGHVITFGKNSDGQLGAMNTKVSNALVEVKALKGKAVNRVQSGDHYSVASTKDHELFYWGLRYHSSWEDTTSQSSCTESSTCANKEAMRAEVVASKLNSSNGSQCEEKEDGSKKLTALGGQRETNDAGLGNAMHDANSHSWPSNIGHHHHHQRSLSASSQECNRDRDFTKPTSVIILKPMELIKLKQVNEEKMLLGNIFCHGRNLFIQVETTAPPPRRRTFKKRNVRRKSGYSLGTASNINSPPSEKRGGSKADENNSCSSETSEMDTRSTIPTWLKIELAQSSAEVNDGNEADDTSAQSEEELRTNGIDSSMCSIQINLAPVDGGFHYSPNSALARGNLDNSLCSSEGSQDPPGLDNLTDSSSGEVTVVKRNGSAVKSRLPLKSATSEVVPISKNGIQIKMAPKGKVKNHHAAFRPKSGAHGFLSDVTVKRREESLLFELERVKQEKKEADARVRLLENERSIHQTLLKQEVEKLATEREKTLLNEVEKLRLEIEAQNNLLQVHQKVVEELQHQLSLVLTEQQHRATPRGVRNPTADDGSWSSNGPTPRAARGQGDDSSSSSNFASPRTPRNFGEVSDTPSLHSSSSVSALTAKKSSSRICVLQ